MTTFKDKIANPNVKTFILQFVFKNGNGWAFINATTITQAQSIFSTQTQYKGAKVTNIKETKYFGENIQLVYEGAVTTVVKGNALVPSITKKEVLETIKEKLNRYYTKAEVQSLLKEINVKVDLSDYYTKEQIDEKIRQIPVGEDAVTPHIDSETKHWMIGDTDTGILAEGKDGTDGTDGINGIDGKDGKDGDTPYINKFNNHWIIGSRDTGVVAKGVDGTNGVDGTDGVGISDISYTNNPNSGAVNELTITLSNGNSYSFNIYNGRDGAGSGDMDTEPSVEIVETSEFGVGSFNAAWQKANEDTTKMFQWILNDLDDDGNEFSKIIWHIGNCKFIDTLGASILGHIDGVTIVCDYPCIWRTLVSGRSIKDVSLNAGINNFSFSSLYNDGIITDLDTPFLTSMSFVEVNNGTETYCKDSVISIDFGGLAINDIRQRNNNIEHFLSEQNNLTSVDRLVLNVNYDSNFARLCQSCPKLRYANISGILKCVGETRLFPSCPNLRKLNIKNLNVQAANLTYSFGGLTDSNGGFPIMHGSLLELDISGINTTVTSMSAFCSGQGKLRKLIIGNFNTSSTTSGSKFYGVSNCVLICKASTPPTIASADSANAWINPIRFSAIYVPDASLEAYRTAWSDYADMIFSINTYIDTYNE
jgi:hypothetical protein